MASSRGRERLKDRQNGTRSFVFGSSTPRDLSYMNKIPAKFRSYDAKVQSQREGPALRVYMEKARSLTREDLADKKRNEQLRMNSRRTNSKEARNWAFGSSTPRDLAHMTAISTAQRVYDSKSPKKSVTSPEFATPVHKRSTTAPQPIQRPSAPPSRKRVDDDAASEPDFVQDRVDFGAEARKKKAAQQQQSQQPKAPPKPSSAAKKKEVKEEKKMNGKVVTGEKPKTNEAPSKMKMDEADSTTTHAAETPKTSEASKSKMEEPNFTHAAELASEVRSTERVPQNLHEEESATAQKNTVREMKDQIVVSELTESPQDREIVVDKDGAEKLLADQKSNEILKKVENVSADLAKDLKDTARDLKSAVETNVEHNVEIVSAAVEKAVEGVDEVLKKVEEVKSDATAFIGRVGEALVGDHSGKDTTHVTGEDTATKI